MKEEGLYREFAHHYDKIYAKKKYQEEVDFIDRIIRKHKSGGKHVLDVACGSGSHAKLLVRKGYTVLGIDKNSQILKLARKKVPKANFRKGIMSQFNFRRKFDAVLCMFTAINYNTTTKDLVKTLRNFKNHLEDGGVIIFDFPILPKNWISAQFFGDSKAVLYERKNIGKISKLVIYWLFKKKGKAEVVKDSHTLRFYGIREFSHAIKQAGLKHRLYWDFSLNKKKGSRPVIVCTK